MNRSLITLKAMVYAPSGGDRRRADGVAPRGRSVASATGTTASAGCATRRSRSTRSWSAAAWRRPRPGATWFMRAIAGAPDEIQIMYGVRGERRLTEFEIPELPGYEESRPGAHRQRCQRPVPARRLRRGRPGAVRGAAPRPPEAAGAREPARKLVEVHRVGVAAPRRRHLGGARRPASLRSLEDDGVGRHRPLRAHRRRVHGSGRRRPPEPAAAARARRPHPP